MHYRILNYNEPLRINDEYWNETEWKKVVTMFGYPAPQGILVRRPIPPKTKKIAPGFNAQRVMRDV